MAQINKANEYFNTLTYTGDGVSPRSITGVGFQPDFVWYKNRTNAMTHGLQDVVRGVTSTNVLSSDNNPAEPSFTNIGYLSSFDSDGFTATETNSNLNVINASGSNYVAWNWLAGGSPSSNTDGTITSSVSVNTTSGFSIVSYTGTGSLATVGHGLGVTPKMIIVKTRGGAGDWSVYHSNLGNTKNLKLNSTAAEQTSINYWNNTSPDVDKFTVNDEGNVNGSSVGMIAYCFAEKKGFSKFSTFTGNGNADGTFVYTGFKPAFVMWKNTTNAGYYWHTMDNKREPNNPAGLNLFPNLSDAENDYGDTCDFVSNGFKFRTGSSGINATNQVYIYMAFAENPLVGTNNIPATAR